MAASDLRIAAKTSLSPAELEDVGALVREANWNQVAADWAIFIERGRVYAVDINPTTMRELQERLERERVANVEVIVGTDSDPRLPSSLDAVLIVNTYHEMTEHQVILDRIRQSLTLEGRLVIVEPIARAREHTSRAEQRANHEIAMRYVVEDLQLAGFSVIERRERFVENLLDRDPEWLVVATPNY